MPITIPASIPISRITTLMHIINDPIIRLPRVTVGIASGLASGSSRLIPIFVT
jgi:hypothetical protein